MQNHLVKEAPDAAEVTLVGELLLLFVVAVTTDTASSELVFSDEQLSPPPLLEATDPVLILDFGRAPPPTWW